MIEIKRVSDFRELEGIQKLQTDNLKRNLSEDEAAAQGFVTAEYSMELLRKMHESEPSIIAKDGDRVVGYALVTLKSVRSDHALLGDLIDTIDSLEYERIKLKDAAYVVVGQLCVAKDYRRLGLVQQMYQLFRNSLEKKFDFCLTDVAQENPGSLKAHLKSGFKVIDTLHYGGQGWDIVLWDWRAKK